MIDRIRCIGCSQSMAPHLPDNSTEVPVCPKCWAGLSITERVATIGQFRNTGALENLGNIISEGVVGVAEAVGRDLLRQFREGKIE